MAYNNIKSSLNNNHVILTLDESLNDYPKLTVVEYTDATEYDSIGSIRKEFGLFFRLDSFTVDIAPVKVNRKVYQVTYVYTHVAKSLFEFNFVTSDFVENNKNNYIKKSKDTYYYNIGTLIDYVKKKSKSTASITSPNFTVPISSKPSPEDTLTLKQLIDDRLIILGLIYSFRDNTLSFSQLGNSGFVESNFVSNVQVGHSESSSYFNTILNWSKKDNYDSASVVKKAYKQIKSPEYILYEGNHNAHLPPPEAKDGTIYPRDLSIMADNSGITKSCKITKYKWGQPDIEINAVFGYAHAALELVNDPEKGNASTEAVLNALTDKVVESGNAYQEVLNSIKSGKFGYPDDNTFDRVPVWRLIEIKQTTYKYEKLNLNITPRVKKADGTLLPVVIPPQLVRFLNSNIELLTREETVGWSIKRFAQEDASNWVDGSISNWLSLKTIISLKNVLLGSTLLTKQQYYWMLYYAKVSTEQYLYRKIPLWERVDYAIEPYTRYYNDSDKIDWETEDVPIQSIPGMAGITSNETVKVLYPDPNWEPNLLVTARSRLKTAVGLSGNPNYDPWSRNYFGSNPITLTSGTEEYELTKYTILPSKNTKTTLGTNLNAFTSIPEILEYIETDIRDNKGTFYPRHPYMTINDYGIKDQKLPQIDTKLFKPNSPEGSLNKDKDDLYATITTLRSAQDHSYKSHITTTTYTLAEGRPPRATTRKPVFEEIKQETENNAFTDSITYLTSSNASPNTTNSVSINISGAENIQEALAGAKFKLILDNLSSGSTASGTLNFKLNNRKSIINSSIQIPDTPGKWIVKRCTVSVQYTQGKAVIQPINIECGKYVDISLNTKTVQFSDTNNSETEAVSITVDATLPLNYGTPITSIPKDFSRWLDTN